MLHAVHGVAEQPNHEAHAELGHDSEDVGIHRDVHQRHHEKQLGNRQFGHAQQQDGEQRRNHHKQRIEDVVGRNHPRPLMLRSARLDQCVQRHNIEAAKHAQPENIEQYPPCLTEPQYAQPVVSLDVLRHVPRMPPQQQAKDRQAK